MFVPGKSFKPSLMFVDKAGVYPSEATSRIGTGLTHKHKTRMEKFARDEHSSLLRTFVNYRHKKFYNIGSW